MFKLLKRKPKEKPLIIGKEYPFTLLIEDKEGNKSLHFNKKFRVLHEYDGKEYFENVELYKIVDNALCVKIAEDKNSRKTFFIVFTKDELIKILEEINIDEENMLDKNIVLTWSEIEHDLYEENGHIFGVELDLFNGHKTYYFKTIDKNETEHYRYLGNDIYKAIEGFNEIVKEKSQVNCV